MKPMIRTPFFEIGVKNYLYGDDVLRLAQAASQAAKQYDIDVLFIAPYTEIRRVAETCPNLIVLAPYMDILRPGRGMADVLPEAVHAAGARGVVMNHCEKPMSLTAIRQTIERANELEMLSFVCADTVAEAKALAHLHPDIINPEPTELIGKQSNGDMGYIKACMQAIKEIAPEILVEQAAGISNGKQVYDSIMAGAEAVGAASGICTAPDPCKMAEEMIYHVYRAKQDLLSRENT
jgi:triosephosphate isomerase